MAATMAVAAAAVAMGNDVDAVSTRETSVGKECNVCGYRGNGLLRVGMK